MHRGGRCQQASLSFRRPQHQLQRLWVPGHLSHGSRRGPQTVLARPAGHQSGRLFGRSPGSCQSVTGHSFRWVTEKVSKICLTVSVFINDNDPVIGIFGFLGVGCQETIPLLLSVWLNFLSKRTLCFSLPKKACLKTLLLLFGSIRNLSQLCL